METKCPATERCRDKKDVYMKTKYQATERLKDKKKMLIWRPNVQKPNRMGIKCPATDRFRDKKKC